MDFGVLSGTKTISVGRGMQYKEKAVVFWFCTTENELLVLWNMLKIFDIDKYYTDNWSAYSKYIPSNSFFNYLLSIGLA